MDHQWNTTRTDLFKAGITALFVAFNKPIQEKLIELKADLLSQTLHNLPDGSISSFFKFIREGCDRFPSDAEMSKLLRVNHKRFIPNFENPFQIEYKFTSKDLEACRDIARKYPAFTYLMEMLVKEQPDPPDDMWKAVFFNKLKDSRNFK